MVIEATGRKLIKYEDEKENVMVDLEQLKRIMVFQGLSEKQLLILQPYCKTITFKAEDKLFTEGDPTEHLWVVVRGAVDLRFEMPDKRPTSDAYTISSIDVGQREQASQTFGWSCFIPPYKMRLSAYCVANDTEVIRVAKKDLVREFEKDPQMGYAFLSYLIRVVGYRFHQFQDEVAKIKGVSLMSNW